MAVRIAGHGNQGNLQRQILTLLNTVSVKQVARELCSLRKLDSDTESPYWRHLSPFIGYDLDVLN